MPISPRTVRRLVIAAQVLPRLLRMKRRTWKALAVGLVVFVLLAVVLVVWAAVGLVGWVASAIP